MVILTWIAVVILELIHAPKPDVFEVSMKDFLRGYSVKVLTVEVVIPVCEKQFPFMSAFALHSCSRNCNPATDLAL